MRGALKLLPLLAALLLTAGSAWAAGPVQTLVLKQGQVFQVTLAANHTTGYKWMLAKVPDAKVVKLVTSNYVPDKAEGPDGKPRVGVGGHEIWTFQAMGPGRAMIVLNYARPWEKDKKPAKGRSLEVEVR
ncbi:MAG: protease inhibitor I42 family protein [Desulfarculaceae bacterium]|nr:protease inhibitor I42 family protein [Desulfarculaceae bacterium]MCF8047464.1 protease inhibitor I42 family protein [Desulfarculaceae bacterium]MCF8065348.1 protease inhibitor I42 family protein [Desulfarculaceae bacterium]MCF8098802.1 protease inhibitor I42 family protein [Desulfarculaceae bacterium]MCF8124115.1 protease inhibitor I42 family protein [Desulfarculaceae bacterium]